MDFSEETPAAQTVSSARLDGTKVSQKPKISIQLMPAFPDAQTRNNS